MQRAVMLAAFLAVVGMACLAGDAPAVWGVLQRQPTTCMRSFRLGHPRVAQ